MTNPPTLKKRIDGEEANQSPKNAETQSGPIEVEASDETYVEATLPTDQSRGLGEQKMQYVTTQLN